MQSAKLFSKSLLLAVIALILLATFVVPASAAELTVGPGGQYTTIQQAVHAAKSGDTVSVAPGTYTENVIVDKPLTITAVSARPTVHAADASKDVFMVTSPGVRIDGLTITGGESGVMLQNTSKCVVTNVLAQDNARGVYLSFSTENEISNNNLANNGYGVYGDYASRNTISSNVATGERGGSTALGDGIFLNHGDLNTITRNNLSANHVFGISIYTSTQNIISNNTMRDNVNIGVRLGPGSNNNTLTFNTFARNGQTSQQVAEGFPPSGILIVSATGNQFYLNNFISQPSAIVGVSAAILDSPEKLAYTFNSVERTSYMSNYYSDYTGTDANGTGIGSAPSAYGDKFPLIQSVTSYGTIIPVSAVTPTPSPQSKNSTTVSDNQSIGGIQVPNFPGIEALSILVVFAVVGLAIAFFILRRPPPSETTAPE
ncbi:MAG: right-handed parallel beta-helix repeat-containing protein [Halobacteriota archaeon]